MARAHKGHGVLKIGDGSVEISGSCEIVLENDDPVAFAHLGLTDAEEHGPLPARLVKRARESDLAFRAIQQRDALAAENEALRAVNAALAGENRRAWNYARRLEAERG